MINIKKCCNCKSTKIIITNKDTYCAECGLVLASTTQYVAGKKYYLPYGLMFS